MIIQGIDLDQLIYQLANGQRLPEPTNCPANVFSLMKNCFKENPHHRPDFDEIKQDFEALYHSVLSLISSTENEHEIESSYFVPITNKKTNQMHDQYLALIQNNGAIKTTSTENSSDECRESLKYASLDNISVFGEMRAETPTGWYMNVSWVWLPEMSK